jgi:outer membrane receptor protein involved in Fe transport
MGEEMARAAFARIVLAASILGPEAAAQTGPDGWSTPTVVAQAETPPAPATSGTPAAQAPGAVELPPVSIIQSQPARPKPAKKAAPAPQRAVSRVAAPADAAEQAVAMTPVKGSEISLDKVPGSVSVVSSAQIQSGGSPALQDALQQYVPGAIVSDVTGNPFSVDVQYRGYSASPVEGTPQGLAVYQNGVRINEVFGDTVNWDLIPSNAINSVALVSGNPLYGLNALGGALNISLKDGFSYHGVESDTRAGSWGRFQEAIQAGKQVDNFAAYVAVEDVRDNGWRQFSPSDVKRAYIDLGVRDKNTEFHINFTGAESRLGAVGPTPVELLAQNYSAVFTNPQVTENQLAMLSLNGSVKLTDSWTASGAAYVRSFHQSRTDGNLSSVAPCNLIPGSDPIDAGYLCLDTTNSGVAPVKNQLGVRVPVSLYPLNGTIGEIDYTTNNTTSYGTSLQAADKEKLFGLNNIFIGGASVDHGEVKSTSIAQLGLLDPQTLTVTGNGTYLSNPLDIAPVNLTTTTNYYSLFFTDTLDLTKSLSATVGGRYNYEELQLADPAGLLTGNHSYTRFNPMAGLTYKLTSSLSAYAGYSEANRAPTPAELACANPAQPCLLQNFLISDPNLKQVVSKTWQGGFRGNFNPFGYGRLDWSAGVFHTENFDDILNVTDPALPTRGYFMNAGNSLRQGVEASARYSWERLTFNANYAYVDATFLSNLILPSPNNPFSVQDPKDPLFGNIFVHPGDKIPTIPAHRLKASFDYDLTDQWKIGTDVVLASSQYFFGDQSNQNPQLPGYGVVNLRTSYEIEKGITLYGQITNLFDHKFTTYGTFYDTQIQNVSGQLSTNLTNPEMVTPGQPLSVYGGIRLKF